MDTTLYWHDYETFGADPRRDRAAQFAGIRTDEALNEIGEPLVIYCKPACDVIPHPEACLLTGITPQLADEKGLFEPIFIAKILAELAQPATCGVGYNTLRFDDEITRHTLYRNFFDPYAREWQNSNSRWDIIDLARMTYALRPDGITWPRHEDGRPSFRLEDLTAANGIGHASAHDALSDVRATISLAALLRDKQPRLYKWLFQLRNKHKAAAQLDTITHKPVLHTSRMYPAETGCTTLIIPLIAEPGNNNSILVYDLRVDPQAFIDLDVAELTKRLFTATKDLPEGMTRLPVKSVKINKCPALAPQNTLNPQAIERIAIDLDACQHHWQQICNNPGFMERIAAVYTDKTFATNNDVDSALYEGFIGNKDRLLSTKITNMSAQDLAQTNFNFQDKRLPELLFRYRARNWPETLSEEEAEQWQQTCRHRLESIDAGGSITLTEFSEQIVKLRDQYEQDNNAQKILDALDAWKLILLKD